MRTIHNYVQAVKARREENGDEGFSLIELIVVVVILGVLAAIAIPVFTGLQAQAEQNAVKTIAANGATQVASDIAKATTAPTLEALNTSVDGLEQDDIELTVALADGASAPEIDNFYVTAEKGDFTWHAGPSAPSNDGEESGEG